MKTLEELEGDVWPPPEVSTGLVLRCHTARKKPIDELTYLELATLLDQKIGTEYILPEARRRIAASNPDDTEYYDGQLIDAVAKAEREYAHHVIQTNARPACRLIGDDGQAE